MLGGGAEARHPSPLRSPSTPGGRESFDLGLDVIGPPSHIFFAVWEYVLVSRPLANLSFRGPSLKVRHIFLQTRRVWQLPLPSCPYHVPGSGIPECSTNVHWSLSSLALFFIKITRGQDAADLDLSAYFHPAKSPLLALSVSRLSAGPEAGSHAQRSLARTGILFEVSFGRPVASIATSAWLNRKQLAYGIWRSRFLTFYHPLSSCLPISLQVYVCPCFSISTIHSLFPSSPFSLVDVKNVYFLDMKDTTKRKGKPFKGMYNGHERPDPNM